jgi:hypothetical protein
MQSLTGQYECVHRSGVGLDYFTSRIDRLTLYGNGRFLLVAQDQSRISHAARSILSGQQVDSNAPETRREGRYSSMGSSLTFTFDDGDQAQGQLAASGIQIGSDFYEKVSDSTFMPPTHRLKSNMEDIAKGVKIAGTVTGAAMKALKSIQDAVQPMQGSQQPPPGTPQQTQGYQEPQAQPGSPSSPSSPFAQPQYSPPAASPQLDDETHFCDQCGAPVRPGKRFCNRCGARLP